MVRILPKVPLEHRPHKHLFLTRKWLALQQALTLQDRTCILLGRTSRMSSARPSFPAKRNRVPVEQPILPRYLPRPASLELPKSFFLMATGILAGRAHFIANFMLCIPFIRPVTNEWPGKHRRRGEWRVLTAKGMCTRLVAIASFPAGKSWVQVLSTPTRFLLERLTLVPQVMSGNMPFAMSMWVPCILKCFVFTAARHLHPVWTALRILGRQLPALTPLPLTPPLLLPTEGARVTVVNGSRVTSIANVSPPTTRRR